jgi:hypothetical protein
MFEAYQKAILRCFYAIGGVYIGKTNTGLKAADSQNLLRSMNSDELLNATELPPDFKEKVRNTFLECQNIFLDGIEYIVTNREGKDLRSLQDTDETRWDSSGMQMKITTNKSGSLVLDSVTSNIKLKSSAYENRDTVFLFDNMIGNEGHYDNGKLALL